LNHGAMSVSEVCARSHYITTIWSGVVASAPVLEALATCILAVYGALQWKSIGKNNELIGKQIRDQQSRWAHEDEERKRHEAIRYKFGVEPRDTQVVVWVVNLGITSFFIGRVWLTMSQPFDPSKGFPHPKGLHWNVVLSAGDAKSFVLPEGYSLGSQVQPDAKGDTRFSCEVWLQIEHMDGQTMSEKFPFEVVLDSHERLAIFSTSARGYIGR